MFRIIAAAVMLLGSTAAAAEWREATTKHFVVYSESSEKMLREAAVKLEKFDYVLRALSGVKPAVRPVKLRVYLMDNVAAVARAMPFGGSGVGGFYSTGPNGPFAVGVAGVISGSQTTGQQVLFHEYAHHFMFQNFPATYPSWYSEGFAEYYGSTRILANDVVEVGHVQQGRYYSFESNDWLPVRKLLTARSYADVGSRIDLLYAQGWLLVHFAANNAARQAQLKTYLAAINKGSSYEAAMNQAFGLDAGTLDAELRAYARKSRINAVSLPFKTIDTGTVAIRVLRPAEQALIEKDVALQTGVSAARAAQVADGIRGTAARFPEDPYALSMLVEAERLVRDNAAATAATERWLLREPANPIALMHKAELRLEALRAAGSRDAAAYSAARDALLAAHRLAPREPRILRAYYESYADSSILPPAPAQNALVRAFELVPQDGQLRYMVARDFEQRDMIAEAIQTISPAAFALHGAEADPPEARKKKEASDRKFRLAGSVKRETPREMLDRLTARLASGKPAEAGKSTPR